MPPTKTKSLFSEIIKAGFIVGTLDISAAFVYYYLTSGNKDVFTILRYISSAVFGKEAFTDGVGMSVAGLIFHYVIAFSFTIFYFWIFRRLKFFSKNILLAGITYGLFVWAIMNLVVVPLTRIGTRPFNLFNASINAFILIICIGIPLAFVANKFYKNRPIDK
jgi:uncharacterized membrane protein YagU involved in acid resistance